MGILAIGSGDLLIGEARIKAEAEASNLLPVPDMKRQYAIFEKVGTMRDPDPHNMGRILAPSYENLPTSCTVLNKSNDQVRMHYITQYVPDPKGSGTIPDPMGEIIFNKGVCMVSKWDKAQYEYMMRHPENKRNSKIYGNVQPTFYLVDTDATKADAYKEQQVQYDAETRFRGIKNPELIRLFALSLQVNTDQELAAIKFDILHKLRHEPNLIDLLDSPDMLLKAVVYQAFDMNIIQRHPKNHDIGYNLPQNGFSRICSVPMGTDNYKEFLVSWLKTDNTGTYMVLRKKVELEGGSTSIEEQPKLEEIVPESTVSEEERLAEQNRKMMEDLGLKPEKAVAAVAEKPKKKTPQEYAAEKQERLRQEALQQKPEGD